MNLKKLLICGMFVCSAMVHNIYAEEECKINLDVDGKIEILGMTEELPGTTVTYLILRPGFEVEDITYTNVVNAVEKMHQNEVVEQNEGYMFSYEYQLPELAESGKYIVSVNITGTEDKFTSELHYSNLKRVDQAVEDIENGMSVADTLDTYGKDIDNATNEKYVNLTDGQKSFVQSKFGKGITKETLVEYFKKYTDMAQEVIGRDDPTKKEFTEFIEEDWEELGISEDLYSDYEALTNTKKEVVAVYMDNNYKDINTIEDFIKLFEDAVKEASKKTGNTSTSKPSGGSGSSGGGYIMSPTVEKEEDKYEIEPVETVIFEDMNEAEWANEAVERLARLGIVNGKSEKLFAPNDNITREEFVSIVIRAFQLTKSDANVKFTDCDSDAWYYESVKIACSNGIINGISADKFGVGQKITRQDMAVILKRAVSVVNMGIYQIYPDKTMNDLDDVSEYAKDAVEKMTKAGKINGKGDNLFKPMDNATRAEAAQMIFNVLFK